MIKVSNINNDAHTADFTCLQHGGSVTGLNLNTNATYTTDNECVAVNGSELTASCACVVFFPTSNGNTNAQAIAAAKTA